MLVPIIVIIVLVVLVFYVIGLYNGLVRMRNQVKNAWSQIDVQLKRRHDLIPNLMETVKGYMQHERDTLESVTKARVSAVSANTIADKSKAEDTLTGAMTRFFAVAESYPDLKANQNFLALQEELASTENKISFSRQAYNDSVLSYNNKIQVVPSNLIAGMFNFTAETFFEVTVAAERETPKVSFK